MPVTSGKIYSRDIRGKIRYWQYAVDGDRWRGMSGMVDGAGLEGSWTRAKPKNVGRKNATTAEEQAALEAEAEFRKKLGREYRRTIEELDSVPPAPMLAQRYDKREATTPEVIGVACQPKLDGIRQLASEKHGLYSRDYQPFGQPVDHIREALAPLFKAYPGITFDGELYNHAYRDDFNAISSMVRTDHELSGAERAYCRQYLQYHIYDIVDATMPFRLRAALIHETAEAFSWELTPLVPVLTFLGVDTTERLDQLYADFRAQGYEGQMIRAMDAPYESGARSWSLIKRKEKLDGEFPISRLITGEGAWDGIPKAIEYILPDDKRDEAGNRPRAGIKGNMDFCRALTAMAPEMARVEYFALTPAGIPRFPVAVDFFKTERQD